MLPRSQTELDKALRDALGVPWHIVSWPKGIRYGLFSRAVKPLLGRPFALGLTGPLGLAK